MSFVNPFGLFLLAALPVAVILFVWRNRVRNAKLSRLGDMALLSALIPNASRSPQVARFALWSLALASLIIALARPVWGMEVNTIQTQGVSVMVVLDVSKSMNAQDILPYRLERAKLAIKDLLDGLAGNELGLIGFAGTAFVQFPLTLDTTSAATFLEAASTDAITRQGTNIDAALRLALESFHSTTNAQPIIVLMTDGENHEGDPLQVAALAAEQGIIIHAIGYGNPDGGPIPIRDANSSEVGYQTDRAGNLVVSTLDETTLRQIAERTGGTYQRASASGDEITKLMTTIKDVKATDLGTRTEGRGVERFAIFVALALVALSMEILLPELRGQSS